MLSLIGGILKVYLIETENGGYQRMRGVNGREKWKKFDQ
jgi:hypothetical protein